MKKSNKTDNNHADKKYQQAGAKSDELSKQNKGSVDTDQKEMVLPAAEEGPAGKLAKDIDRKVAGSTEAELRKRTSSRHVKDPFGDEEAAENDALAKETEIWDNDDSEPESDGKIGGSGVVEEGNSTVEEEGQPLTAENVQAKQSQFANAWDDDIKLDDGEGSDIGSELTEEMNQNIEVKVKKKKK